ncbi:hypothetical protein AVEN_90678-1 [Araneus ventricosus]|uniref:Uncharacterized protein n=1 Tax=Araneus ventricosus TaxID=182803 RepID=A0A4Y2F4B2_ARAVE|nr:hypothetical protein AVEN_90678-1 [Araneus ventricosus]
MTANEKCSEWRGPCVQRRLVSTGRCRITAQEIRVAAGTCANYLDSWSANVRENSGRPARKSQNCGVIERQRASTELGDWSRHCSQLRTVAEAGNALTEMNSECVRTLRRAGNVYARSTRTCQCLQAASSISG